MRTWIAVAAVLLGSASVAAQACDYPPLVMIPAKDQITPKNVAKITEATNKYLAAMETYRTCLQAKLTAAGETASPVLKNILVYRNNAAVAEETAVQNWFTQNVGQSAAAAGPPQEEKKKKN